MDMTRKMFTLCSFCKPSGTTDLPDPIKKKRGTIQ